MMGQWCQVSQLIRLLHSGVTFISHLRTHPDSKDDTSIQIKQKDYADAHRIYIIKSDHQTFYNVCN